uniref:Uncharacterized protein n=1 Tax=Anopheles arabiensis TaxID=7173 RepID=A0A182IG95_ANOAR
MILIVLVAANAIIHVRRHRPTTARHRHRDRALPVGGRTVRRADTTAPGMVRPMGPSLRIQQPHVAAAQVLDDRADVRAQALPLDWRDVEILGRFRLRRMAAGRRRRRRRRHRRRRRRRPRTIRSRRQVLAERSG